MLLSQRFPNYRVNLKNHNRKRETLSYRITHYLITIDQTTLNTVYHSDGKLTALSFFSVSLDPLNELKAKAKVIRSLRLYTVVVQTATKMPSVLREILKG